MDDDLAKLRDFDDGVTPTRWAADRIEALEAERDVLEKKLSEANATYTEMHLALESLQDELQAAVAAEREACAEVCEKPIACGCKPCHGHEPEQIALEGIAEDIRSRANTDALDARDARVRAEALREAIDAVHQECWTDGDQDQVTPELLAEQATTTLAIRAIKALIPDQHKVDG